MPSHKHFSKTEILCLHNRVRCTVKTSLKEVVSFAMADLWHAPIYKFHSAFQSWQMKNIHLQTIFLRCDHSKGIRFEQIVRSCYQKSYE